MRNLEDRMTEIRRRSEQLLARRRKWRNRLLTCIPLVLCVCLSSAYFMTNGIGDKSTGAINGSPDGTKENDSYSLTLSVTKIEVTGNGVSQTVTDTTQIIRITSLLNTVFTDSAMGSSGDPEAAADGDLTGETADQISPGYTIVLRLHGGGTARYSLCGSELVKRSTAQTYRLTEQELQELNDLLGMPQ